LQHTDLSPWGAWEQTEFYFIFILAQASAIVVASETFFLSPKKRGGGIVDIEAEGVEEAVVMMY
jgi:hypothetical protein